MELSDAGAANAGGEGAAARAIAPPQQAAAQPNIISNLGRRAAGERGLDEGRAYKRPRLSPVQQQQQQQQSASSCSSSSLGSRPAAAVVDGGAAAQPCEVGFDAAQWVRAFDGARDTSRRRSLRKQIAEQTVKACKQLGYRCPLPPTLCHVLAANR
jgi:hypothetical protein